MHIYMNKIFRSIKKGILYNIILYKLIVQLTATCEILKKKLKTWIFQLLSNPYETGPRPGVQKWGGFGLWSLIKLYFFFNEQLCFKIRLLYITMKMLY